VTYKIPHQISATLRNSRTSNCHRLTGQGSKTNVSVCDKTRVKQSLSYGAFSLSLYFSLSFVIVSLLNFFPPFFFQQIWPSMQKHILSTKAFSRGFEVTLKPFGNPLETLWNPFETLWKPFWNTLKPFWNALKPFGNPFEMLWNPLETLLKRFETLLKRFETLWKPFRNALKLFGKRNTLETPLKCSEYSLKTRFKSVREKNIFLVCVRWRNCTTALHVNFFGRNVILPYDSVLIYLWLWKDQKI